MKKLKANLKEKFFSWVFNNLSEREDFVDWLLVDILEDHDYWDAQDIEAEIEVAKQDIWDNVINREEHDNLEYEVEEQANNISDHEDRIDVLEEKLKKYDKIFKKLKSVDSWEVKVDPEGESKITTVTSVQKEEIDEE